MAAIPFHWGCLTICGLSCQDWKTWKNEWILLSACRNNVEQLVPAIIFRIKTESCLTCKGILSVAPRLSALISKMFLEGSQENSFLWRCLRSNFGYPLDVELLNPSQNLYLELHCSDPFPWISLFWQLQNPDPRWAGQANWSLGQIHQCWRWWLGSGDAWTLHISKWTHRLRHGGSTRRHPGIQPMVAVLFFQEGEKGLLVPDSKFVQLSFPLLGGLQIY